MTKKVVNKKTGKVYIYENYKPKKKQSKPREKAKDTSFYRQKISARRGKTEKQYAQEIFEKNKEAFERAYDRELERRQTMIDKYGVKYRVGYEDAFDFFYKRSKLFKKNYEISYKQAIYKFIEADVANKEEVFVNNFMTGMKNHAENKYNQFMSIIEEQEDEFDFNRLKYVEDSIYTYRLANGKVIDIEITNSPMEWKVTFDG